MPIIKKLVFALPFLLALMGVYQYLGIILGNVYLIFDFNVATMIQLAIFLLLLLLAGLFFIIFATLASDIKLILPVAFLGSFLALIFLSAPSSLIVTGGFLIIFVVTFFTLSKQLSSYLTFQPTKLLIPSISQLATMALLITSLAFYLAASTKIQTEGFQIPDSIIDASLKMAMPEQPTSSPSQTKAQPKISPEQLQLLKQNPQLLKQYGLDPAVLDQINTNPLRQPADGGPQSLEQNLVKIEVKKQLQNIIAPQIQFIAPGLALVFFLTMKFGLSVLSVILYPLIALIFLTLEKTGFTTYTKETREVKKLVV